MQLASCRYFLPTCHLVQMYAGDLFSGFAALLVDLKPEANRTVMGVVEIAIQSCPFDVYFQPFVTSGLFFKVMAAVLDDNVSTSIARANNVGEHDREFAVHEHYITSSPPKSGITASFPQGTQRGLPLC